MLRAALCLALLLSAGACAIEPGTPVVKTIHGEGGMPPFAELNYAIDFGERCSPPDAEGRRYASLIWLRANRTDGSYQPLRATPGNCNDETSIASAE